MMTQVPAIFHVVPNEQPTPHILSDLPQAVTVTVDESVREDEGSNDEEKDKNVESSICQLLDQRTASQRRDKSCAPSH